MSFEPESKRACRLCGATTRALFEVHGCQIDRCASCGFVQVRERPSEDELRAIYCGDYFASSKYDDADNQLRENRRRLALLERAGLAPGSLVLDAGCATGDFIAAARDRYQMSGLDVSPDATAIARDLNPSCADRIYTGFVEDTSLSPGSFDAIVLWDVIEHVWDPASVVHQLASLLRPGGVLALSTPDIGALTARLMRSRWAFMTPPEHLGFFASRSMSRLIESAGLDQTYASSRGKWVNAGFFVYKLGRVFPAVVPDSLVRAAGKSPLAKLPLYVPTMDIQYVLARKT